MIHPGFSRSEYEGRLRAFQRALGERELVGAIVTAEANYNYLAGYHHFAPWTTFCRPVFLVIPTDGEPVLLVHAFPAADAKREKADAHRRSEELLQELLMPSEYVDKKTGAILSAPASPQRAPHARTAAA